MGLRRKGGRNVSAKCCVSMFMVAGRLAKSRHDLMSASIPESLTTLGRMPLVRSTIQHLSSRLCNLAMAELVSLHMTTGAI